MEAFDGRLTDLKAVPSGRQIGLTVEPAKSLGETEDGGDDGGDDDGGGDHYDVG